MLGCHGGQLRGHRTTSFLLDGTLALDAGTLCQTLSLEEVLKIDHIVLTHAHFDHIKDVPLLADLLTGRRDEPVVVHGSPECIRTLQEHVFNDKLWPDFTTIPSAQNPVMRLEPFELGKTLRIGDYTLHPIPVDHPVESVGYLVEKGKSIIALSGDTGPTDALWTALRKVQGLGAVLLETSFPNALQRLAEQSGHLTPQTMSDELTGKFAKRNGVPVLLYHLKPAYTRQLYREVEATGVKGVRILELDEELSF